MKIASFVFYKVRVEYCFISNVYDCLFLGGIIFKKPLKIKLYPIKIGVKNKIKVFYTSTPLFLSNICLKSVRFITTLLLNSKLYNNDRWYS